MLFEQYVSSKWNNKNFWKEFDLQLFYVINDRKNNDKVGNGGVSTSSALDTFSSHHKNVVKSRKLKI